MDTERLKEELTCPITHDLMDDPVTLPCCGKACDRSALVVAISTRGVCPLCRHGPLQPDVANDAPTNRVLQSLIGALLTGASSELEQDATPSQAAISTAQSTTQNTVQEVPKLTASFCLLPVPPAASTEKEDFPSNFQSMGKIARLQLRITNATRVGLRRVLCILVVDQSGSMAGNPWRQASLAMKHVVAISHEPHVSSHVSLRIVTYNSSAFEVDCSGSVGDVNYRINNLRASMGTSFRAAFRKTVDVMRHVVDKARESIKQDGAREGAVSPMPHSVHVVFMTDGQAWEEKANLADELRDQILKFQHDCQGTTPVVIPPKVTIHSVGFSGDCDRALLERIRNAGTYPGQFRYCEPGDSEDALCGRLTGMFEAIAAHGGSDVTVERLAYHAKKTSFEFLGINGDTLPPDKAGKVTLQVRTKPDGVGTAVTWVSINVQEESEQSDLVLPISITCNVEEGQEKISLAAIGDKSVSSLENTRCPSEHSPEPNASQLPGWTVAATKDTSFASIGAIKRAWVGVRIHAIAEDAITLATAATVAPPTPGESVLPPAAVHLWSAFLEHRLRAVSAIGSDAHNRVPALTEQLKGLSHWQNNSNQKSSGGVSIGRLRDISSASAFSSARVATSTMATPSTTSAAHINGTMVSLKKQPSLSRAGVSCGTQSKKDSAESWVFYSGNNTKRSRNALSSAIMNWGQRYGAGDMVKYILGNMSEEVRSSSVMETDADGNSSIHLAAYYGQDDAIPVLLKACPIAVVEEHNHYGETPVTIAIKRRGYHRTVEVLQSFGASIPKDRVEDLIRFCLRRDFARTAAFLKKRMEDGELESPVSDKEAEAWTPSSSRDLPPLEFDESVPHRAVKLRLKAALASGRTVDYLSIFRAGLRFADTELVKKGLEQLDVNEVHPSWIFEYCFPRKADAPDTNVFLEMLDSILNFSTDILAAVQQESGDTLLHRAVISGSLLHAQFLVSRGLPPDGQNSSGNTPLQLACLKRYPCIVDFLISTGADVNMPNNRGITPISAAIQMGSQRIVETLIAAGAMTDGPGVVTIQGRNLLHVAVQNNQSDILALLIDRAEPETLLENDENGLNAIFTAIEGDRRECLKILLDAASDYSNRGVPGFEDITATALHVAVRFGRRLVLSELLERGADPNATDSMGKTPLHCAAQRGDAAAVYTLLSNGASKSILDNQGGKPASYGMAYPDVVAALVGPIPGPLLCFCSGDVSDAKAAKACEDVIRRAPKLASEPGIFGANEVLDTPLDDAEQTALIVATSHGNIAAVKALMNVGCSPKKRDKRGLSAEVWAQMMRSQRLLGVLGVSAHPRHPAAERVLGKLCSSADAMSIFLGGKRDLSWPPPSASSSIHRRLVLLAEAFSDRDISSTDEQKVPVNSLDLLKSASRSGAVDRVMIGSPGSLEQCALEADSWSCKIDAAGAVAAGASEKPSHIFAALLSTKHGPLVPCLNDFLGRSLASPTAVYSLDKPLQNFSVALFDLLCKLPPFEAEEIFAVAPKSVDKATLTIGSAITLRGFVSATSEWSIALSSLDKIHGMNDGMGAALTGGKGVILIIKKCYTGCAIGEWSAFPEDREVMFSPGAIFRVCGWYRGSVQALGQRRIRDEFTILPEQMDAHINEDSSLLIEVEEIS